MLLRYVAPTFELDAFNCPGCGAFAKQEWGLLQKTNSLEEYNGTAPWRHEVTGLDAWATALCSRCGKPSLWFEAKMVYPVKSAAPEPHPDMPFEVWEEYDEARAVLDLRRARRQLYCVSQCNGSAFTWTSRARI